VLLCAGLVVEGASTGLWVASRLPVLRAYGAVALALVLARGVMGVLQLVAGSLLWRRAPAGVALAPAVFLASAALYALEIGLRLRPSSVYPGARWLLVAGYGAYAVIGALLVLRRRPTRPS
jgi:hypothetical protein